MLFNGTIRKYEEWSLVTCKNNLVQKSNAEDSSKTKYIISKKFIIVDDLIHRQEYMTLITEELTYNLDKYAPCVNKENYVNFVHIIVKYLPIDPFCMLHTLVFLMTESQSKHGIENLAEIFKCHHWKFILIMISWIVAKSNYDAFHTFKYLQKFFNHDIFLLECISYNQNEVQFMRNIDITFLRKAEFYFLCQMDFCTQIDMQKLQNMVIQIFKNY